MKPVVIKVGGSLIDYPELPERFARFVALLRRSDRGGGAASLAVAPGGGKVVDAIREADRVHRLTDDAAHWLAIHALDVTARLLGAILPGTAVVEGFDGLAEAWHAGLIPILSPGRILEELERDGRDRLPASWEVTSDSIAARLATALGANRLILLKSAKPPAPIRIDDAVWAGLVDPYFSIASNALARVEVVGLRDDPVEIHEIDL